MGFLLQCITNEICEKVKDQIQLKDIFRKRPLEAIDLILKARTVLDNWQIQYNKTR